MSNNDSKTIDEAVTRMAALINHMGIEFNSFLKFLAEQGYDLSAPSPPPMLDTATLDRELGGATTATEKVITTAAELYSQAALSLRIAKPANEPDSLEEQIERMRAGRPAGVTLGVDCGLVETMVGEVEQTPVSQSQQDLPYSAELQALIDTTRVRVEAQAEEGFKQMRESLDLYVTYPKGVLLTPWTGAGLSETIGSHTLAAIRGEPVPTQGSKKMGEFYREAIDDSAQIVNLRFDSPLSNSAEKATELANHGLGEQDFAMDLTGLIPVAIVEEPSAELPQAELTAAGTKLRELQDDPVVGALLETQVSKASPVSDIAAALMLDNVVGNNTIGDSPDYATEAAQPVAETMVTAEQANAANKFKYYEQMAFKDVRGLFRHFFSADVIEGGKGNIGTEKTDKFISAQRYREDVLRIGAPRTAKFPIGMYRDSESGGYQLYLPTDFPRASDTKINLLFTGLETDDYKIFFTKYDEQQVPVFEELDPKDEHAETIFLIVMESLRAHQLFNKQFKVL